MDNASLFDRLVKTTGLIARHADYPGKSLTVQHCLEDLEDLTVAGRVTHQQGEVLREILLGSRPRAVVAA